MINENKNLHSDDEIKKILKEHPHNLEAEQGLLGALLNNNEYVNRIADFLLPDHFYMPLHKKIYESILRFLERQMVANPITLKSLFVSEDEFTDKKNSSFDYLIRLSANATTIVNIESFAKAIYETAVRRKLITIGEEMVIDSFEEKNDLPAHQHIEKAEQKLFNLALQGETSSKLITLKDSVGNMLEKLAVTLKRGKSVTGVTTGYIELDKLLGGLQESDLLIIAARPSMGKTSLAINLAINAAESFAKHKGESKPKSVGIFSLEMSSEQLAMRILSIKTKVSSSKIRLGLITKEDFAALSLESNHLNTLPMFIDDSAAISISALRTRARRLKRQHNLGLIVVDYLQLLTGSNSTNNRVNEIGEISQGLKAIAKELNVPVVALSQLSRAVESRDDKRPQLSDLRESGNIEQDADVVMFIYRAQYYLERKKPVADEEKMVDWQMEYQKVENTAEVLISKQRNGPIGNALLRFDPETTAFDNLYIPPQ